MRIFSALADFSAEPTLKLGYRLSPGSESQPLTAHRLQKTGMSDREYGATLYGSSQLRDLRNAPLTTHHSLRSDVPLDPRLR